MSLPGSHKAGNKVHKIQRKRLEMSHDLSNV